MSAQRCQWHLLDDLHPRDITSTSHWWRTTPNCAPPPLCHINRVDSDTNGNLMTPMAIWWHQMTIWWHSVVTTFINFTGGMRWDRGRGCSVLRQQTQDHQQSWGSKHESSVAALSRISINSGIKERTEIEGLLTSNSDNEPQRDTIISLGYKDVRSYDDSFTTVFR